MHKMINATARYLRNQFMESRNCVVEIAAAQISQNPNKSDEHD